MRKRITTPCRKSCTNLVMQSVTHEIEFSNEQDTWGAHQLETATGANAWGYQLLHEETNTAINRNWLQNKQSPGNITKQTGRLTSLTGRSVVDIRTLKLKGNVNSCPIGTN